MEKKLEKRYDISRIITKMAFDSATDEEKVRLQIWLDESPLHREEYDMWMKRLPQDLSAEEPADVRKAWKQFVAYRHRQGMHAVSRRWYAAVAAIAVLLAVAGVTYFLLPTSNNELQMAAIVPGSERMILQTSNGERVQVLPTVSIVKANGKNVIPNEHGVLRYDLIKGDKSEYCSIYHTMVIPRGGEYQVVLSDGTHIYMNSESEVKYPMAFSENGTRDIYIKGEAYLEVAHNPACPFIVHTRNGAVEVKGTKFDVCDYDTEYNTTVTLAEGSVLCSFAEKEYLLSPGMQFNYNKQNKTGGCTEVDVESYISWHTGLFEFNAMPLNKIMASLSRWYDVDYHFNNPELASYTFTGVAYRNSSLSDLLNSMQKTTQIHFYIKDRTIIISK